jgi:hypothetical protein
MRLVSGRRVGYFLQILFEDLPSNTNRRCQCTYRSPSYRDGINVLHQGDLSRTRIKQDVGMSQDIDDGLIPSMSARYSLRVFNPFW